MEHFMELAVRNIETPASLFRWRESGGIFHDPREMETRHLFFTLRMIWNHSMPKEWRIEPYRSYRFRPFYTAEYMRDAVAAIGAELFRRQDLQPRWKSQLNFMASKFEPMRPLLLN